MPFTANMRVIRKILDSTFWTGREWGTLENAALFKTDKAAVAVADELGPRIAVFADYNTPDERVIYSRE